MKVQTRGVLAGAYEGGVRRRSFAWDAAKAKVKPNRMLSHAVELDDDGRPVRVLCGRVALDSMSDMGAPNDAGELDMTFPPTCERCLSKDPRQKP